MKHPITLLNELGYPQIANYLGAYDFEKRPFPAEEVTYLVELFNEEATNATRKEAWSIVWRIWREIGLLAPAAQPYQAA